MHQDCPPRHLVGAGALCASLLLVACGGGGDSAFSSPTDAVTSTASTLLDDDGGVMPPDPRALSSAVVPGLGTTRYATAAQARALYRSLGDGVRWIEIGCCGDAAVEQAISRAVALDASTQPAVLVSGADARLGTTVVDRLMAAGLDRVWWVSP